MAKVEVLQVTLTKPDRDKLEDFWLDGPRRGERVDSYSVELAGGVVGRYSPAQAVEVKHFGQVIRRADVWMPRTDIAVRHAGGVGRVTSAVRRCANLVLCAPNRPAGQPANCGFGLNVSLVGLPPMCDLELQVVLVDGSVVPVGTVRLRHAPLRPAYRPRRQPVVVSGLGRSGTTWLMHLLAEHPSIVVQRRYPFESLGAIHTMRMLQLLTTPANPVRQKDVVAMTSSIDAIASMPLYCKLEDPTVHSWLRREYVEHFAEFALRLTDALYGEVARQQEKADSPYFSEKFQGSRMRGAAMFAELYAAPKELFLVRDFRDTLCSRCAFKQKGGDRSARIDDAFLKAQLQTMNTLLANWKARSATAHLVRYEDLVLDPVFTLQQVCTYLGIDDSTATAELVLRKASTSNIGLESHLTSPDPLRSIGRWKRDLPAEFRQSCNDLMAHALEEFGYARVA